MKRLQVVMVQWGIKQSIGRMIKYDLMSGKKVLFCY